jgi:P4 family phage/plasmid primase-like protien
MTSTPNKEKISRKAEEIDEAWIDEITRQQEVEVTSLASIYVADRLEAEGHVVPTVEDVYNTNDKGKEKFSVEAFTAWAESASGERFVSLNQGKDPYIYKDGVYIQCVEGWLKATMNACNQNAGLTTHYVKEVVARVGANRMMDEGTLESQDPNITVVGNCALNTLTGECQVYDPDHVVFSKLAVKHVPDAQCPTWDEFLEYTLEEDDRLSLQELFGYCLVRAYPYHAAWFLLGAGQNGKGVAMAILRAMLGKHNCSAVPLQEVNERFYSHDLYNKYANISGDTSPRALCDASMYKMLTGGDEIRVEQKGKDAFDFVNHAKIISSMNELMKSDDQSDGFFRRFVLIRFTKTITTERIREKDGFEREIINNEMSGVLNWAIEGLIRVRAQGGFSWQMGKTKNDLRKIWNAEADRPEAFINECCERCGFIEPGTFHHAYTKWHEMKYGVPPKEEQGDITKAHGRYGFGKGTRKTYDNSYLWDDRNSIKCYTGVSLKNTVGNLSVYPDYVDAHWHEITGVDAVGEAKGLSTMSCKQGVDMELPNIVPPEISEPVGSEIMNLIQDRVKAYGGNTSDHAMSIIECWIEDRGYAMEDIKFCMTRYREGHRIFTPCMKEA